MSLNDQERAAIVHKAAKFVEMVDRVVTKGAARDKAEAIRIAAGEAPDLYAAYALSVMRLAHGGDTLVAVAKAAPPTITAPPAHGSDQVVRLYQKIIALLDGFMQQHPGVPRQEALTEVLSHEPGKTLYGQYARALAEPAS